MKGQTYYIDFEYSAIGDLQNIISLLENIGTRIISYESAPGISIEFQLPDQSLKEFRLKWRDAYNFLYEFDIETKVQ